MVNLRISDFYNRSKKVNINVNNKDIEAYEGECLAVVLFINNIKKLRLSPKKKQSRGMYCLMGSCQECVVLIDEKKVISCNVFIKDGMKIKVGDFDKK
jgi:predicted molibdopterin-dependent oxidoreductase YjgC